MFRIQNVLNKLSRKSITFSRGEIAVLGGAAALTALIYFGGGNGVHNTTADDIMPDLPPQKPAASTCLTHIGSDYSNRCNETIKVVNCLPIDTSNSISAGGICYELTLKPRASFSAATTKNGEAQVGACYMYQIPYARVGQEGFVCR